MRTREDEWAPSLGTRATPTRSGMRAVGSFVPGLTAKAFAKHGFTAAGLAAQWSAIVGPELAAYTLPEKLRWPPRAAAGGAGGRTARRSRARRLVMIHPLLTVPSLLPHLRPL